MDFMVTLEDVNALFGSKLLEDSSLAALDKGLVSLGSAGGIWFVTSVEKIMYMKCIEKQQASVAYFSIAEPDERGKGSESRQGDKEKTAEKLGVAGGSRQDEVKRTSLEKVHAVENRGMNLGDKRGI